MEEIKKYFEYSRIGFFETMDYSINQYAYSHNKTTLIGGPVSIAYIDSLNNFSWKQNNMSDLFINHHHIDNNIILNDSVKINYIVPNGKQLLLNNPEIKK